MSEIRNIVLVGPSWPLRGGISLFTVRLYEALRHQGVDARVIGFARQYPGLLFPAQSQDDPEEKPGVGDAMIDTCNPMSWVKTARHINALQPDALVFSWWHFWFWPCYKLIARMVSMAGIPVVFLCHNYRTHDAAGPWTWFSGDIMKNADGLVFLSRYTREQCRAGKPLTTVLFHPYYEWKKWPAKPLEKWTGRILVAGCIKPYKGIEDIGPGLLCRDKRLRITIAGDVYNQKMQQYLRQMEKRFAPRLTVYPSYVSDRELVALMDSHDLLLCSHKKATQSGMAAFAFGRYRPVVATPAGGLARQIHPKTGVVAARADTPSVHDAIQRIYRRSPGYWAKNIQVRQKKQSFEYFSRQLCATLEKLI